MSSSSLPRAVTRKTISLPAWPGVNVIICRVSVKQIGMDAGLRIVSNLESVALASENAAEANTLAQQAQMPTNGEAPKLPRAPTQPFAPGREDRMPAELKQLIMREAERSIVRAGLVEPTFEQVCEAYEANPDSPETGMGPDWDFLVQEIMVFSGEQSMGHVGMRGSPEEVERFPGDPRGNTQRHGQTLGQNSSRTRKRKRR